MTSLQPMRLQVRSGNSLFFAPSIILDSAINKVARKSKLLAPFSSSHGDSIVRDSPASAHIIHLLMYSSPATILRCVVAIVIDAVNRVLGSRLVTHISKEVFKRIKPSIANLNTPTSVSGIFRVSNVVASIFYASPRVIFWSPCFAMCKPVWFQSATTRAPLSSGYSPAISNNRLATVARKKPIASFVSGLNELYSGKTVKLIASNIDSFHISPLVGNSMKVSIAYITPIIGVKTQCL